MSRGLLVLACAALACGSAAAQELSEESFEQWRDYLLPADSEVEWRRIPWRTRFWDAMQEADGARLPVLLWAMNGHLLGCT